MRLVAVTASLALTTLGASAAEPPSTYAEVAAVVAAAERGEMPAADALALVTAAPGAPLAGAALGRLRVLNSHVTPFGMLKFLEMQRGFEALKSYVNNHREDPLPRVWRAASAVETNYALWSLADTRQDLVTASNLYRRDPALPDQKARCKLLLGLVAKDDGELEEALRLWAEAFAADPTGAAGKEAAKFLELFTG